MFWICTREFPFTRKMWLNEECKGFEKLNAKPAGGRTSFSFSLFRPREKTPQVFCRRNFIRVWMSCITMSWEIIPFSLFFSCYSHLFWESEFHLGLSFRTCFSLPLSDWALILQPLAILWISIKNKSHFFRLEGIVSELDRCFTSRPETWFVFLPYSR